MVNLKENTRRYIAIFVTVAGVGTFAFLAIKGNNEALTILATIVSTVLAFYFGMRSNQTPN